MPQSREHLAICRMLGIQQGCLVISGIDQVEPDLLAMVIEEVQDLARGSFLHGAPIFSLSTASGQGVEPLRSWLTEGGPAPVDAKGGGSFRLSVDRAFSLPDGGLVATGAVLAGRVAHGESLLLYPQMVPVRVHGLQVHRRDVAEAGKGGRVALHLQGVDETMIERGDVLAAPGGLTPSHILDVDFSSLADLAAPFPNRTAVRVHLGAAELAGHIVLLETETLAPGNRAAAQLFLEEAAVAWPGERFLVRSYSPPLLLGGGMEPQLMRLILDELAKGGTARTVAEAVSLSPDRPFPSKTNDRLRHELTELYRAAALTPRRCARSWRTSRGKGQASFAVCSTTLARRESSAG